MAGHTTEDTVERPILEEFRSHFNEPVLLGFELARVVGYGEDYEDCYLICDYPGGKRVWCTAVGGYVFLGCLKGQGVVGESDDFLRLDQMLELNGAPKVASFIVTPWVLA